MRCKSPRTGAHETSNCRMLTVLMVLIAWSATIAGGGALAWNFICERGFVLRALPGTEYGEHEETYLEFFGDDFDGAQAGVMLSHDTPFMEMTNISTCKMMPFFQQRGDATELELSCKNETAAGSGCITTSQLRHEVFSLVGGFLARSMSSEDLSRFLRLQVQPMLDAAPDVMVCPYVDDVVGNTLMSISSKIEESMRKEMPHCQSSILSFWSLPAQQFHGSLTLGNSSIDVTVNLPAGNYWSVFDELLSSKDRSKVLVAIQTETCNGLRVADFSEETLQIASLMQGIASEVPSLVFGLEAEVMSFAVIVEAIKNGVEEVMAISTATLPLGIGVLAYMVGNGRMVIIAMINVLAAVAGSVLVMNYIVVKLMPVSIFTPPFLIAVVLSMSIDYSLFLLSRFIKETQNGASVQDAVRTAMATSGRIVAQAGVTLACCFSCLLMIPVTLVSAMGAGGLAAVCMAMMASLTLTPALILLRPAFWVQTPGRWCACRPCSSDVEAQGNCRDSSSSFWSRFGHFLRSWARPVWLAIMLLAAPCAWELSRMPQNMVGFMPALPAACSAATVLQKMGEAFGYEAIFPTTLSVISPEGVGFEEWRLQACHGLQEISKEVEETYGDFTSSKLISEVMIGGKCMAVDVNGTLLQWKRSSRDGTVGTVVYVDYPVNPLSASGQAWLSSLQKAVEEHQVGNWFVRGVGPLVSTQAEQIQQHFPHLLIAMLCIVLFFSIVFTWSCSSSLRALFCLSWMLTVLWALSTWVFGEGLYYVVPPMMLPFLVGVALDYDIFYTEAVLEECKPGVSSVKDAGIDALGKTANTITAAGLIMIIAFLPLLLSSTLVLRQIGFMATGGLFISAFWNTKVVMPLCLQLLDRYSFWPWSFEKKPVDVIFLGHPGYLVDCFCLLSAPQQHKRWTPSWWMYPFLPVLWLLGFCTAHLLRRLGLPTYLVLDEFKYNGLRVQTWAVLHFGRHFRNSWELYDARRNVLAAVQAAEKTGARVLGLGALNKAEFLNRGGRDLVEKLPSGRRMRITHGDHLTAAAVVENVVRLLAKLPESREKPFMTGATGKTGKAVALALLQRGIPVICHSSSQERREELESYGLETASKLQHGAKSVFWIVGKYDRFVHEIMPPSSVACVFAVPNPIARPDIKVFDGATLQMDESLLEGQRANLKLRRDEIYACNAATLVLASGQADEDDLGDVEPMTLQTYLRGAEGIGITLPDASF